MKFLVKISTIFISYFVLNHANPIQIPNPDVSPHASGIETCLKRHGLEDQGDPQSIPQESLTKDQKEQLFICKSYPFFKTLRDEKTGLEDGFPDRAKCEAQSDMEDYSRCIIQVHNITVEDKNILKIRNREMVHAH